MERACHRQTKVKSGAIREIIAGVVNAKRSHLSNIVRAKRASPLVLMQVYHRLEITQLNRNEFTSPTSKT
jgi:hypothetical protein